MTTTVNPAHTSIPAASRAPSMAMSHTHNESPSAPHHVHHHHHDVGSAQQPVAPSKKLKNKKAIPSNEASKLIAARIGQLEMDAAGDKEQEAEIEREVKKANRELNNFMSNMDELLKIETLQKRVTEHLTDMKRLQRENQTNKKRRDTLQKEKDHARTEQTRTNTLKERLEKLCRELQKENNRLKNETKTLQDAAKENHSLWDDKYRSMLWQLQDEQADKDHPQAQVVNVEMDELFKQRFKSFIEQYELRELHFHSVLRTKELEVQYNMARYDKERKAAEAEIAKSRALNNQVQTFSNTEAELRNQLNVYVEKFKQVEDTLNNSNDLFLTFRKEMEEMSKKTKKLEKENSTLTRKQDLTNQNILKMAEERTKTNMEIDGLRKKNEKLTSIINQMQKQGRGMAGGMANIAEGSLEGDYVEGDLEGTDSEYEYEEGDGEEGDEEESEEYDEEDTEEEAQLEGTKTFGPVPPPTPLGNGVASTNGTKH